MSDGLYIQITGKLYRVERIPFVGDQRGWKLTAQSGKPYQVIRDGGEWERASGRAMHNNMQALECADSVAEFRQYLEIL